MVQTVKNPGLIEKRLLFHFNKCLKAKSLNNTGELLGITLGAELGDNLAVWRPF